MSERWLPKKFLYLNAAVSLYFSQQSAAAVFSCYCVLSSQSTLNISGDETAEKNDIKVNFHLTHLLMLLNWCWWDERSVAWIKRRAFIFMVISFYFYHWREVKCLPMHNTLDFFKTYRSIMLMVEFLVWNHAWYLLKEPYFWQFLAK